MLLCSLQEALFLTKNKNATDNDVIETLIGQASAQIESYCGYTFEESTKREVYKVNSGSVLVLNSKSVSQIVSVKVNESNIDVSKLYHSNGAVTFPDDISRSTVKIEYIQGYTDLTLPADIRRACALITAEMYVGSNRIGQMQTQMTGGFVTYRAEMSPQIKEILNMYRVKHYSQPIGTF